jgi:hypothetical protein
MCGHKGLRESNLKKDIKIQDEAKADLTGTE